MTRTGNVDLKKIELAFECHWFYYILRHFKNATFLRRLFSSFCWTDVDNYVKFIISYKEQIIIELFWSDRYFLRYNDVSYFENVSNIWMKSNWCRWEPVSIQKLKKELIFFLCNVASCNVLTPGLTSSMACSKWTTFAYHANFLRFSESFQWLLVDKWTFWVIVVFLSTSEIGCTYNMTSLREV